MRYTLLGQQDDFEQSVLGFTESIFLPHRGPCPLNIVQTFYYLTLANVLHAEHSRQPKDIKRCIMYLHYLRGQWHEVPVDFPVLVTAALVHALAVQVDLELGDVDQDIEEMAGLCNELLNSDISITSLTAHIIAFARAVDNAQLEGPPDRQVPSEKVIKCLQKAIMRLPELHEVCIVVAESLCNRFDLVASDDDYQEGMAILDKVITFRDSGDRLSPYSERAVELAVLFTLARFWEDGKPEYLEQAIYRLRTLLDRTPLEEPYRALSNGVLSFCQGLRLNDSSHGVAVDVQDLLSSLSESAGLSSFRDLTASLPELNDIGLHERHFQALRPPSIERLTNISDIEDGVKYCRQLLSSYPDSELVPYARETLPQLFLRAFECTNQVEYLDEAISAARDNINPSDPPTLRSISLISLAAFLFSRFNLLDRREDLDEIMQLFATSAHHEHAGIFHDFPVSCQWASIAHHTDHPSASTAYDRAMSSMQASLTFSPTLDIQHSRLIAKSDAGDPFKTLPLDYASYQIGTGRLGHAIEILEQGRGLLWSEMRGLRTSIGQIRLADPDLADKFAAVNRDLETVTLALSPKNNVDNRDNAINGMDQFGHLVLRQQELLGDREKLIPQIQALPGLDTFLKPPSFDALRSAASHGPVIIINHCEWQSDILILLRDSPPSLIPTSDDFYARANKLQDQLLGERKDPGSYKYDHALRSVLKELYELVGQPVIQRLNELNIPEQSRIWWCPTSVFCSLPLHAMGPVPDMDPPTYFLDLYIPSYTPSLSALIESHKPASEATAKPSILLVTQPDDKMPLALKEMKAVQAVDTQVTTLFSKKATPIAVLECLRDHRFAHIVCHGKLEPGKPFEASFKLYKGRRLPLLDIVRSQLLDAEFAFLSACHTAELTDESIADEVLHLAAAMQFCGFRSVVGTMWAMADIDGRDLARYFYASVFSNEMQGARYYERTAEALRDAVKMLRRKGGITLERWVNFVHYGA